MKEPKPTQTNSQYTPNPDEQNAQARLVLIQLQWLITILLIAGIIWLSNNQRQLEMTVDERLKITKEFNSRINDIDDRLFALTPTTQNDTNQQFAESDLQLIRIQLNSANQLYQAGNYKATEELLQSLLGQLSTQRIDIAPPLKATLSDGLKKDLAHLDTFKSLPDAWQSHIIKMQEIQGYLRQSARQDNELNRQDLARHDASIMLSLAIGAGTLRERDTMTSYLNETLANLELLQNLSSNEQANNKNTVHLNDNITGLDQAIYAVNELLANPPKNTPLISPEVLK